MSIISHTAQEPKRYREMQILLSVLIRGSIKYLNREIPPDFETHRDDYMNGMDSCESGKRALERAKERFNALPASVRLKDWRDEWVRERKVSVLVFLKKHEKTENL